MSTTRFTRVATAVVLAGCTTVGDATTTTTAAATDDFEVRR